MELIEVAHMASRFGMDELVAAAAAELANCPAMRRWALRDVWLTMELMRYIIGHFKSAFRHHDTTKDNPAAAAVSNAWKTIADWLADYIAGFVFDFAALDVFGDLHAAELWAGPYKYLSISASSTLSRLSLT